MGNTISQESFFRSVQGFISNGLKYLFFLLRAQKEDEMVDSRLLSAPAIDLVGSPSFVRREREYP
jgi:hypothetical protein